LNTTERSAGADPFDVLGNTAHLKGTLAYEDKRQVWNAMIDRHPAVVVTCSSAEQVQNAVRLAADRGLAVSVRGGGHNIAGTAVADEAMMIDLSGLQNVDIDPGARLARVEGGATWAMVDAAAQHHSLAAAGGIVSETGVGGLTLGGGIGWLARQHGLSIDNLLSAEVVLADGRLVVASEDENPDLFWALRGGGGNFGIVTAFSFRLHDIGPNVCFGPTVFALEDAARVLMAYAEMAEDLPREACVWANLMTAPAAPFLPDVWHGRKVLTLMQFHASSTLDDAQADLLPLYGGANPIGSAFDRRLFVEAQSFLDPAYAFGARNYWRTHNHRRLTPGLIETLVDLAPDLPTPDSELLICQLGGAVGDVDEDATAFAHRNVPFVSTPGVRWQNAADDHRVIGWLKMASDRIAEHADAGAYSNFVAETADTATGNYGANLSRLSAIKHRYDPGNRFRVNQNILPVLPRNEAHTQTP
jgi:FAD/FMN-containing dehydrogenase